MRLFPPPPPPRRRSRRPPLASLPAPGAADDPEVIPVSFSLGVAGVREKLAFMRGLISLDESSPGVRALAAGILRAAGAADPRDHRARLAALLAWVQREMLYVHEVPETFVRARRALLQSRWRFGDCDCKVIALATLCESIGYPTVIEAYGWDGAFHHVALLVGTPPGNGAGAVERWHPAEPTLFVPLGWDAFKVAAARAAGQRPAALVAVV
jgi:transglutaminase-like putative cysteine protease